MPILLKGKTASSPGIVVFTHGEALWGVPAKSKKVKNFLIDLSKKKDWLFGVHVQGNLTWLGKWPKKEWQNFFMWPNKSENFLQSIPKNIITDLTCINFYDDELVQLRPEQKKYDIISITRFSSIKKTELLFLIFKELLKYNPKLKIILISPIPKKNNKIFLDEEINELNNVRNIVKKQMTPDQLKQISFICTPQDYFGRRPLSDSLMYDLISMSKNLIMTSHMEGVPRAIAEPLNLKTNIIVSNKLFCGTTIFQNKNNSFVYKDDLNLNKSDNALNIANQINDYLKKPYVYEDKIDNKIFLESENIPKLKLFLNEICKQKGVNLNDEHWCLDKLSKRLASHGDSMNLTFFNNEKAFFNWFKKISSPDGHLLDEITLYEEAIKLDKIKTHLKNITYWMDFLKTKLKNGINNYINKNIKL